MRHLGWFKSVGLITAASISALPFIFSSQIAQSQVNVHMTMGNPTNAVTSTSQPNNYLLLKNEYALSYNNSTGTPNWVSWQLNPSWVSGSDSSSPSFQLDPTLPSTFYKVSPNDYASSGFDRGQMVAPTDRTTSPYKSSTFLMTNIIPQAPANNQGVWANLETYLQSLVAQGKELYIISGPSGSCGTGSNGSKCSFPAATNSSKTINVPASIWKVIVVLDNPGSGVSGVTTSTRVIAVNIPNTQVVGTAWQNYRISVDTLEQQTGYNFLSAVPSATQSVIEAKVDNQ